MGSRQTELNTLLQFAHTLAEASAKAIAPHFRTQLGVHNKGGHAFDPVTRADRAAERAMRKEIRSRFPEHSVLGEEYGAIDGAARYRWVIDPIDGTRAFITGSPLWGTLIGLLEGDRPVLGLMNQPFTRERFWSDGRRPWRRGPQGREQRLRTRPCASLATAVLTTTHPDLFATEAEAAAFGAIKARARMTRYGGDCYSYCLLAAGFIDIIIEAGLKPYDVVALVPIIESAGGIITTWRGASAVNGGRIIAAGDARVHREAMALLRGAP